MRETERWENRNAIGRKTERRERETRSEKRKKEGVERGKITSRRKREGKKGRRREKEERGPPSLLNVNVRHLLLRLYDPLLFVCIRGTQVHPPAEGRGG